MTGAALASLLPMPVALPIAGAVAAPLLARVSARLPVIAAVVALGATAAVLMLEAPGVFGGRVLAHYLGLWRPVHGKALGIAFAADPLGLIFALAAAVIGAILLIYTLSELGGLGPRELGGYACLFQLLLAALIGAALTADLFDLFVWFEVAALASYGLTAFFLERPIALEAAFKILVLTTLASFSIFTGTGLLYASHGALNFAQLQAALHGHVTAPDLIALGLLIGGFATKAGLVPFHGWLADAHTAAPGPVSALFSGLMVNLGIVAIARVVFGVYGPGSAPVLGLLLVVGLASALLGAVLALAQDDLKRLLAYDTISQMGILAIGLSTGSAAGIGGAAYHLVNHALFKSLLFLCAGAVVHRTGLTSLSQLGGLARRMPVVTAAFVIGALSIAGVPPFNGYVSLGLIHQGLLEQHEAIPYALMLAAQVITIAALGRAAWLAFFRPRAQDHGQLEQLRPGMLAGLGCLAGCCLAFGVAPRFFLETVMAPAAAGLLHPGRYASAVLSGSARLPLPGIPFDYASPGELAAAAAGLAVAGILAWGYLRIAEPAAVRVLRAAHNGSANDYAAYAVTGTLAVIAAVSLLPRLPGHGVVSGGIAHRASAGLASHGSGRHRLGCAEGLLHAFVAGQPVGESGDPQRLGVPVAGARQRQRSAGGHELLPVTDDDRQAARIHEVDSREIEDHPAACPPGLCQAVVELPARDDIEVTADCDDHAIAPALGRQPESFHPASRRTGPLPGAATQAHRMPAHRVCTRQHPPRRGAGRPGQGSARNISPGRGTTSCCPLTAARGREGSTGHYDARRNARR
jgi:multicomponent Na+:H+ antiporter subunit D